MKYKVGDKVKVREWDDMAKEFRIDEDGDIDTGRNCFFVGDMKKFCGKTVTIVASNGQVYKIAGDDDWYFVDEMLNDN